MSVQNLAWENNNSKPKAANPAFLSLLLRTIMISSEETSASVETVEDPARNQDPVLFSADCELVVFLGTGRYGNEAARGTIYSQCAIVIDVPPVGCADRQRCLKRCSQGLPAEAFRNTSKHNKSPAVEEKEAYKRWSNWSRTRVETRDVRRLQDLAEQFHIRDPSSNAETLLEQIEAYVVRHPTMGSGDDYTSYSSDEDRTFRYNRYW